MIFENMDWLKNNFRVDPRMATFYRLGKDTTVLQKSLAERHLHGVLATLYRRISDTSPR